MACLHACPISNDGVIWMILRPQYFVKMLWENTLLFTFPQSPLPSKHSGLGFNKWPIDSGTPSSVVQPISQRPSFLSHELYTNFTEISKAQTHKYSLKEAQYLRSKQLESGCKSVKITIIILLLKNTINTIDEKNHEPNLFFFYKTTLPIFAQKHILFEIDLKVLPMQFVAFY